MKNKRLLTLSLAAGLGLGLAGCSDYLDSDYLFDERMTIETVFTNKDYTNEWLARGYFWLNTDYTQDICSKRFVNFNFADDMYYEWCGYPVSQIKPGMIVATSSVPYSAAALIYGHVGIYVGNNTVRHNQSGVVKTDSLDSWVSMYSVRRSSWP